MPDAAAASGKRRFQFSLAGLLVFVIFLGSVGLVIARWEPWYLERRVSAEDPTFAPYLRAWQREDWGSPVMAPDGVRRAGRGYNEASMGKGGPLKVYSVFFYGFGILECRSLGLETLLWAYNQSGPILEPVAFVDNDTLLTAEASSDSLGFTMTRYPVASLPVFRRRHPEWWWGHFYRPEVWLCIVLGTIWLWRVARWFRSRRAPADTLNPIP